MTTPAPETLADLLARLDDVAEESDGFLVHCPAHPDSHQSLRLAVSDAGKILVRCRAGCATPAVVAALGMTMADLARMTPGDVTIARATSQDVPASPAVIAALAVELDGYAAALRVGMASADDPGATAALDYAARRFGLGHLDCERLGLGYAADLAGGPRLVVPFRDADGVARGYQARALWDDATVRWWGPKSPEGASWAKVAYFEGSAGWDEVLICEGPGDALTAAGLGYDAVGIRGAGLAANPATVDAVADIVGARPVVIAGDGDTSGRRFSADLAAALVARDGGPESVRILPVPATLDLSSWAEESGAAFQRILLRSIATAEQITRPGDAAAHTWDDDYYSLTDLGAARYLRDHIESQGSGVRFVEEMGFYLLDGGVWRRDDRQAVRTHAQAVADLVRTVANAMADAAKDGTLSETAAKDAKSKAGRFLRFAAHVQTSRGLDAMLRELQAVERVPASPDDFDRHPDRLACRNGVIDLRTGALLPHDPSLMLTRRIELDYDPDARAPRWEQFLTEVFPAHAEMPGYMQRLVGYGITGLTTEQAFVVHYGRGANGKSVFTDTLTEVFRDITVTTPFSTFEERPSGGIPNDLAALKGARLVMAAEGEQGKPMAEAVLKRVTGRDLIAARFMRREFFEFRPTFLLMLASNFKPKFKGQDEGLWRRVKLIPWERYFAPHERDPYLGDRLLGEAAGILAWAVRGAVQWFAGGLADPDAVRDATREYRENSNVLDGFFPGVWVKSENPGDRVKAPDLFASFREFADEENHVDLKHWSARTFYGAIEERGHARRKSHGAWYFYGIRRARPSDSAAEEVAPPAPSDTKADAPDAGPLRLGPGPRLSDL